MTKPPIYTAQELRLRAEKIAEFDEKMALETLSLEDARQLFHELRVHQIELEMQNEELRNTQMELEISKARYFDLYDLAPVGYLMIDEQGGILEGNLVAAKILGVKRETLFNKHITDFIFHENQDMYYLHKKIVAESLIEQSFEIPINRKDDVHFWVLLRIAPPHNGEFRVILTDISKRKRFEEELRKKNEQLSLFIKHSPIYAFIKELTPTENRVVQASENFKQMIGVPGSEMIGKSMGELFPVELAAKIAADDWNVVSSGKILECEENLRGRTYSTIKFPIFQDNKTLLAGYTIDITERKQAEQVLQARLKISEYAFDHSLDELLVLLLDEAELLTDSQIGFFHFVAADQVTLNLQTWSTNTLATMCTSEGKGQHYQLDRAGVWADCIRERKTLVHNNYETLPHRKGLPPGHSTLTRELVVPIFRNDLIVAVLGVGNKTSDYSDRDIVALQNLTNLAWDVITRKRVEVSLQESELRFRTIMDQSPNIAVQGYTIDGTTTYWNKASELLYGYSSEEAIGKSLLELIIPPEMREDIKYAMAWMAETGEVIPAGEIMLLRKDGSRIPVFSSHALLKPPGRDIELFCMDMDLTERKQDEEKLRESREKFKAYMDNSFDVIFALDAAAAFQFVSRGWERHFGYPIKDILGKSFAEFVHQDDIDSCVRYLAKIFHDGKSKTSPPFRVRRRDGVWRWFIANGTRYLDNENNPQFIGVAHDITEEKEAEFKLRQAKDAAEAANIAKSDFLATMSHEIRTPLGAMLGNVELLEDTELTPQQHEYLKDCKSASQMLLQVINDVLDFSKIEAGKLDLVNETFSIAELCTQLVRIFSASAGHKGLVLAVKQATNLPEYISADQQRLRQIIANLISNAIKFTNQGTVCLEISCEQSLSATSQDKSVLRIVVCDSGIGIPADKQERIFESFTQIENFSTRSASGTGLGLPICRRLLALMDGSVTVSSVPGEGSVFTVILPVTVVTTPAQAQVQVQVQAQARKVLLADDDERGRAVTQKLLQRKGYDVTAVEDGAKLLDALEKGSYDIVLTDISMPDMEGTQVARIIRSGERSGINPDIPIIALTAHAFSEDRERFMAAGINGYVAKPVNLEDLLRQLEELCSR